MKHKYYVFIYPIEDPAPQENEDPAPQKDERGCIRVVERVTPVKRWAKANGRKLYIQKVY